MSCVVTFEVKATLSAEKVQERLSKIWVGDAREVAVEHEARAGTLVCTLAWYFGDDPEEDRMVFETIAALLEIAVDGQVFYYRFSEAQYGYYDPVPGGEDVEILAEAILGDLNPTMGGPEIRYVIRTPPDERALAKYNVKCTLVRNKAVFCFNILDVEGGVRFSILESFLDALLPAVAVCASFNGLIKEKVDRLGIAYAESPSSDLMAWSSPAGSPERELVREAFRTGDFVFCAYFDETGKVDPGSLIALIEGGVTDSAGKRFYQGIGKFIRKERMKVVHVRRTDDGEMDTLCLSSDQTWVKNRIEAAIRKHGITPKWTGIVLLF